MRHLWVISLLAVGLAALTSATPQDATIRPRARDLGIAPGVFSPGPFNAITDVAGVRVGHFTLVEGDDIRTGATVIIPHGGNIFQEKVPAAVVVGNGFGKLVGSTQVDELGQLETPIILTNTLNVWEAAAALAEYTLSLPGNEEVGSVNPVVGETNDGRLNNIRKRSLRREHFLEALRRATTGVVEEGSVGAGTGTTALRFKGGIGTASRRLLPAMGGYTVGVLVQTNFDGALTIDGVPVGRELGRYPRATDYAAGGYPAREEPSAAGSCMIVVATDAPLDARQLRRLAWRAFAGMARTGADFSYGSGDYVISFSAAESARVAHRSLSPTDAVTLFRNLDPLFQAVAEATEEAIYNSLLRATTVRGYRGRESPALPIEELQHILKKYHRGSAAFTK